MFAQWILKGIEIGTVAFFIFFSFCVFLRVLGAVAAIIGAFCGSSENSDESKGS